MMLEMSLRAEHVLGAFLKTVFQSPWDKRTLRNKYEQ